MNLLNLLSLRLSKITCYKVIAEKKSKGLPPVRLELTAFRL